MGSGKEGGASFTLYFPLVSTQQGQPNHITPPADKSKKGKILVVDDEEVVRELLKGILVAEGFGVLQASDGPGALAIFEAEGESINLVILDMTMPGMKGEDVLNRLRKASKTMKVIISSGFMSEEQRDKLEEYGADGFLDKPYSDKDVINAVESVLSLQYVADLT